jgi:cytochrome c-type biogenesis protein
MEQTSSARHFLISALFVILAIIVFALFWFFSGSAGGNPEGFGWFAFSFVVGLTMIVLPCTLPLAFVIVPLSMGKGPVKGFFIALAFGIGVAATLSLYGLLASIIGKTFLGVLGTSGEVLKNWLYFFAGTFAYLFALGSVGLINFKMPSYTGAFPSFIQKQGDITKALLLGLFLGNIGIGCPHPATPVIFTHIVAEGTLFYGWLLYLAHAIGRILPLLFLAILGILGVNALASLVAHKDRLERATGWGMIFVAAFILVLGLFSHDWWVASGQHTLLESLTQESVFMNAISQRLGASPAHAHGAPEATTGGPFNLPLSLGNWALAALWLIPFWIVFLKKHYRAKIIVERHN